MIHIVDTRFYTKILQRFLGRAFQRIMARAGQFSYSYPYHIDPLTDYESPEKPYALDKDEVAIESTNQESGLVTTDQSQSLYGKKYAKL